MAIVYCAVRTGPLNIMDYVSLILKAQDVELHLLTAHHMGSHVSRSSLTEFIKVLSRDAFRFVYISLRSGNSYEYVYGFFF
jgi:hypothetical protein